MPMSRVCFPSPVGAQRQEKGGEQTYPSAEQGKSQHGRYPSVITRRAAAGQHLCRKGPERRQAKSDGTACPRPCPALPSPPRRQHEEGEQRRRPRQQRGHLPAEKLQIAALKLSERRCGKPPKTRAHPHRKRQHHQRRHPDRREEESVGHDDVISKSGRASKANERFVDVIED